MDVSELDGFIRWPKIDCWERLSRSHSRKLGRKRVKGENPHKRWVEKEKQYSEWFNSRFQVTAETEIGYVQSVRFYDYPSGCPVTMGHPLPQMLIEEQEKHMASFNLTVEDANNTRERGSVHESAEKSPQKATKHLTLGYPSGSSDIRPYRGVQ